jgi:hypothetical protein
MNSLLIAGQLPVAVERRESKLLTPGHEYLIERGHPARQKVEDFIAQRFLKVHGARISEFMPTLLALPGDDGEIRAALGVRDAGLEALFLEHYLDMPVESVLAAKAGYSSTSRSRIAEIGNLASVDRRASRRLFGILSLYLAAGNFEWAVFTGCGSLRHMFQSLGIETLVLGRALQSRLPADQQTWGGYYEDNPQVIAGRVSRGVDVFDGSAGQAVRGLLA